MTRYEELLGMKIRLAELNRKLDWLRKQKPSIENAETILDIQKKAREMKAAVQLKANQYGMAA